MTTSPSLSDRPVHDHPRVILVDDNPRVCQDLRLFLELSSEVEVVAEATNGEEAVRLAENLAPDGIVMDLEMPVLNGYEATRLIKSRCPTIRVVVLSIHGGPKEQEKASAAGADAFVSKSDPPEKLREALMHEIRKM